MKTDDYYDQREEIEGQTPPWTEEEIECAELAEKVLWGTRHDEVVRKYKEGKPHKQFVIVTRGNTV